MLVYIISLGVHGTNENYGAILQIWSFQEFLKKSYSCDVKVIDYYGRSTIVPNESFLHKLKRFLKCRALSLFPKNIFHRKRINEKFINNHLSCTRKYDGKSLNNAKFNADYYIAESDVIWDPNFRNTGFDDAYFLNFKSFNNGKKIVYAASLGDAKFNGDNEKRFVKLLSGLDAYSVREEYSKAFIKKLTGKDTESLLDPTLFHDQSFFASIEKSSKRLVSLENYIFVYFPSDPNPLIIKKAEDYALKNNKSVIYVSRSYYGLEGKKVFVDLSIGEFLFCLKNADLILCDSFHGVCFSVIYKKNFYAFPRIDGKKIRDICNKLKLEDRFVNETGQLTDADINYDKIYSILKEERKKSTEWLNIQLLK